MKGLEGQDEIICSHVHSVDGNILLLSLSIGTKFCSHQLSVELGRVHLKAARPFKVKTTS